MRYFLFLVSSLALLGVDADEQDVDGYNSTIAVIVEQKFASTEDLADVVRSVMAKTKRKYLKNGDLNVEFHTRTDVAIRKNLVAVLSIASCTNTWSIFRNAEDESILHLAITEADCPRLPFSDAITVPVVKEGGEFSQIVLDLRIVHDINWKSVVLLYESTAIDRDDVQKMIASLSLGAPVHSVDPASVSVFKLDGFATEWARRKQIYNILLRFPVKQLGNNFLVIVSRDLVGVVMEVAKSVGLVHPLSQWLYLIPDAEADGGNVTALSALLSEGDNVSFIYNATTSRGSECSVGLTCHIGEMFKSFTVALDQLVREEMDLSKQVSDEEWETIRPTRMDRRTTLLTTMKTDLSENGKCDRCIAWEMKAGETWGMEYQGRRKRDGSPGDLVHVGVWHPREGPVMRDILFPHVVHGFRGRNLPLVSFNFPPWQIIRYNESGHVVAFEGLIFEIIDELASSLNFSYSVVYPSSPGDRVDAFARENGSESSPVLSVNWDKMMSVVRDKEAFMGAGAFIVTEERKRLINFTVPIGIEPYTFLVARPQELSRALLFLSPFAGDTWLCIASSIALMGPVLNWFHRVTPYYDYHDARTSGGLQTVTNCLWYMYGALLQQGGIHLPMADSGRLIIGTWWLYVLVIVTTYSGNLVAFLTFPKIDTPVNTIAELASRRGSITWGVVSGSFAETRLKTNTDPKYRDLYGNAEIHAKQDSRSVMERVRNGEHVYIDWKTNLIFLMKKEFKETGRCDFALATEEFLEEQVAMIVAQGNPYLPRIDEEIKRIHRVGLIYKWLADYLPKKDKCWSANRVSEVTSHTVNMSDMQGSFFVLFLGFIVSACVIVGERIYERRRKARQERGIITPFAS